MKRGRRKRTTKRKSGRVLCEKRLQRQHEMGQEEEAANRRKLLASLDPETREFARREFAKLGLFQ